MASQDPQKYFNNKLKSLASCSVAIIVILTIVILTGLLLSLSCQVLLWGKLTSLEQSIKDAGEIEYALSFQTSVEHPKEVNALPPQQGPTELEKLQETLEKMSKRLGELEVSLKEKEKNSNCNKCQPLEGAAVEDLVGTPEILQAMHAGYVES